MEEKRREIIGAKEYGSEGIPSLHTRPLFPLSTYQRPVFPYAWTHSRLSQYPPMAREIKYS